MDSWLSHSSDDGINGSEGKCLDCRNIWLLRSSSLIKLGEERSGSQIALFFQPCNYSSCYIYNNIPTLCLHLCCTLEESITFSCSLWVMLTWIIFNQKCFCLLKHPSGFPEGWGETQVALLYFWCMLIQMFFVDYEGGFEESNISILDTIAQIWNGVSLMYGQNLATAFIAACDWISLTTLYPKY